MAAVNGQEQRPSGQANMWESSWQTYAKNGAPSEPKPTHPSALDAAAGVVKKAVTEFVDEQVKAGGDALAQGFTAYSQGAVMTMAQAEAERKAAEHVPLNARIIAGAQQAHDVAVKAKPILVIAGGVLSSVFGSRRGSEQHDRTNGDQANGAGAAHTESGDRDGYPDWYVSPELPTQPAGFLGPVNADEVIIDGEYTES